jgi:prophage tail gpP-like protein
MASSADQDFAPAKERVSLRVAGREHDLWDYYRIDSNLMIPADDWGFSLAAPTGPLPAWIKSGAAAEVRIGNDLVLSGRIDNVTRRTGRPARKMSISGRDGAAVLVDCSAPIFTAKNVGLQEVVASIVRPLGITKIRIDADHSTDTAEKVSIEPGIKAWDALQQAAEANGLWPWFDPDGTLVIGGPDYTTPPVATLIERLDGKGNNTLSFEHVSAINDRYSEITMLAQSHGGAVAASTGMVDGIATISAQGQNAILAKVQDKDMTIYRPLVHVEGDLPSVMDARAKARKLLMDGRLAGEGLTAVVKGHRTSEGLLWTPGQRIHVISESLGIDAVWFLMDRQFSGGRRAETTTTLVLKEDGVWVIDAFKTKKGRKGKKLSTVVVG